MANWQEFTVSLMKTMSELTGTLCSSLWWPLATILIFCALKSNIRALIDRVKHMKGLGFELEVAQKATEDRLKKGAGKQIRIITPENVVESFESADLGFKREKLKKDKFLLHRNLLRMGILTQEDLDELLGDKEAIDALKRLYIDELERSDDHPFDPSALSTWGAILHNAGVTKQVMDEIRRRLRQGPEYARKHG